jgi:hypothetical protein
MTRFVVHFSTFTAFLKGDWLTGERVRRIGIIFAAIALVVLGGDAWLRSTHGVTDADGQQLGRDFINYWAGAHLAADGQAVRVYDIEGFLDYQRSQTAPNAHFKWYSYPPTALVLSLPLAALGFVPALVFWLLSGFAICAILLMRTLDWRMALLAAFATPASLLNALSGQNGQFTAALLCGGILFLQRRPWLAGILFGLLCFKPHLAILLPVALAASGRWQTFTAAGATVLTLCASAFLLGSDVWGGFLKNAPINTGLLEIGDTMWHRMPTVFAAVRLFGGDISIAYGMQAVSATLAVLLIIQVWRSRATIAVKGCALVIGTFLVTPYAWDYDLVALTFVAVWLATEAAHSGGFRPWEKSVLAFIIAMPMITLRLADVSHIQIAPLALWAMMVLVARRALNRSHQTQCPQPDVLSASANYMPARG